MLEFIQLLKQRYQAVLLQLQDVSTISVYRQRIEQLILTEAFLRKGHMLEAGGAQPLQIAVVGPTQAGKSSVVNLLLNSSAAGVSPLAGYTVHPQGFCHQVNLADCQNLQRYFGRFQQLSPDQLSKERLDCYGLMVSPGHSVLLPPCVLWDTPDFDSIDSANYREGVLRAVALADVVVLVVSKEKYADQSVWDMMSALEALQQPVLICLNKVTPGSESVLLPSLQEKWRLARQDTFPEVVVLTYQKPPAMVEWPDAQKHSIKQLSAGITHQFKPGLQRALIARYWQNWLEPVHAEQQMARDWLTLIEWVMQDALVSYQRDYLNHPHYYETFQYALAELLTLLEIPGIAGVLSHTRKILTWPVKQIMKLGRKRNSLADSSQELALLSQIAEHMLIQLADKLMEKSEQNGLPLGWKQLGGLLRQQRNALLQDFNSAAQQYHTGFQQEVEHTAQRLYQKLQEQPMVLNGLRATRVTTDAAAIALALHTGGIGMHDLIIAPAMLTVTSLLTESAIGSYVHKVEAELKQQQLKTVKQLLFNEVMGSRLTDLPAQLPNTLFFNISSEQVNAAELQLETPRHGLRLF